MIENYISSENKRLLKLFNKYEEIIDWIYKDIKEANEICGLIGATICRKDFDIVTEEMELYFKSRETFDIEIDWNLNCELFDVNWDC